MVSELSIQIECVTANTIYGALPTVHTLTKGNMLKVERLTHLHFVHMPRHFGRRSVILDQEIKIADIGIGGNGCVGTNDGFVVDGRLGQDTGTSGEIQGFGGIRHTKAKDGRGVRDFESFQ